MRGNKNHRTNAVCSAGLGLLIVFSSFAIIAPNYGIAEAAECAPIGISVLKADDYQGSNVPKNTLDNDLQTRWSSSGKGSWIQLDAGRTINLCNMDIAWYQGNERQYNFAIAISDDTGAQKTVFSGKSSGNTNEEERYEFSDVSARSVKITVWGNTENNWASLTEIDVRGYEISSVLTLPGVDFANADEGSVLSGTYNVVVTAQQPERISRIDLYVDSTFVKTEYNDPYEFGVGTTNFSDGNHIIKAVASDTSGALITETQAVTFENTQNQLPPAPANGGKYLLATMLQYVNTDTLVDIYQPNMASSDKPRIHVGLNKQITDAQLNGLLSLPGQHGAEYFSLAEIKANSPQLKAKGIEVIDYDLEPGDGHSPSGDLANPVASIKAASQAAHASGLLFRCSPARALTTSYGVQMAPYCDQFHIQAQALQDRPAEYESYVEGMVAKLRAANPSIQISVQVSTQRDAASGMTLLETMKTDFARVADKVDGVSVWYSNDAQALSVLESFSEWFDANYRG